MMKNAYRWYVLAILMLVYAFNSLDRNLLSVLAPSIRADLHISDAQIGLLYGTAFALFYGLFGIPLAKLADGWSRVRTLSLGLAFWSLMTAFSGGAASFVQLSLARIGVGIGEASASPAAASLLSDYFPKERRSTVIALYTAGAYIGTGTAFMVGGSIVAAWEGAFNGIDAPFGLAGWQAAFIGVGLPGIILAVLSLLTIREPVRGELEGEPYAGNARPFAAVLGEAASMFPPWSFLGLYRRGGAADLRTNLFWLCGVVLTIIAMTYWTDGMLAPDERSPIGMVGGVAMTSNMVQWTAIGIAIYASISWFQSLRLRDPAAHTLIGGSPTFMMLAFSCGLMAIGTYAIHAFIFVYASRYLGLVPRDGVGLGAIWAIASPIGMVLGGVAGDFARKYHPAGRLIFTMTCYALFVGVTAFQYTTPDLTAFYVSYTIATVFITTWIGCTFATGIDLVPPHMRGVAYAVLLLSSSVMGLGLGPYVVGLISDITGSLRFAILSCLIAILPPILASLWFVCGRLREGEAAVADHLRTAAKA